jgi:hypothetical protein
MLRALIGNPGRRRLVAGLGYRLVCILVIDACALEREPPACGRFGTAIA